MIDVPNPAGRGKKLAAVLGGAAAFALCVGGALAAHDGADRAPVVTAGDMSTGATVTIAYSETEATSVASPAVKAPPFGGSGG
jgi:hypothetical protein